MSPTACDRLFDRAAHRRLEESRVSHLSNRRKGEFWLAPNDLDQPGRILCIAALGYQPLCFLFCCFKYPQVPHEIRYLECRNAGLTDAHHFPGSPQLQVLFGDLETVGGLFHYREPLTRLRGPLVRSHKDAMPLVASPPYSAAELMKLR